jgi:hypothetical protein
VVVPSAGARPAARVYLSRPARDAKESTKLREIDLVVIPLRRPNEPLESPEPTVPVPPGGFKLVAAGRASGYAVTRYRSDMPRLVDISWFDAFTSGDLARVILVPR